MQRYCYEDALARFNAALAIEPGHARLHYLAGLVLETLGDMDQAIASYQQAAALDAGLIDAQFALGNILKKAGHYQRAAEAYTAVLAVKPDAFKALIKLGNTYKQQGRLEQAVACFRQALQVKPKSAEAHYSLGNVLKMQGDLEQAAECFTQALQEEPQLKAARWNRALVWLQLGRYEQAWPDYELGFDFGERFCPRSTKPRWDGESLPAGTVLVVAEQGCGDVIQFLRFLPLVKQRAGRVVFACQPELKELIAGCDGIDELLVLDDVAQFTDHDAHIPLLSLPGVFATALASIPRRVPYMQPLRDKVREWQSRFKGGEYFNIGVVWSGNTRFKGNMERSCVAEDFATLTDISGVRLFSLQVGPRALQSQGEPRQALPLIDLAPELHSFSDTAAVIANLDLVITVDTAVAHLAGAMGRPVWTLLQFVPDWRWGTTGETTPWYPGMRLFRQPQRGDWSDVFADVHDELQAVVDEARRHRCSETA